jgi:hypothetical protein
LLNTCVISGVQNSTSDADDAALLLTGVTGSPAKRLLLLNVFSVTN